MIPLLKKISPREKKLVTVAFVAAALFAAYQFIIDPLAGYYSRLGEEIPRLRDDLRTARRLSNRYKNIRAEIRTIRERLDAREGSFNPYDFLSTLASKEGIHSNLDDIKIDSREISDGYREETASVRLKDVPLGRLIAYLYAIENSGQLITVKELSIKPDSENSLLLDVIFEASTFIRAEGKQPEAERKPPPKKQRQGRR